VTPRPAAETLSPLDSFFLYLESARTPMHTGSVGIFEGAPMRDRRGRLRMRAIRSEVDSRLHLVPKLRQRVRFPLFGEASPVWVDDPDFDVANHVLETFLPSPGTEAQLLEFSANLMSLPLDRGRPLWEIWFVDGLAGDRVALVEKLHHSMADGLAGVELATVLLDLERRPLHSHAPPPDWQPSPPPSRVTAVTRDVIRRATLLMKVGAGALEVLHHPVRAGREAARYGEALSTVASRRSIAPRCSLNTEIGEKRRLVVVRQPMDELHHAQWRFGVTINDLLLAAVAAGVHDLLAGRGEDVEGGSVQVLVPVGTQHHGDHKLGNQVSAMIVRLPIGDADPIDRLHAVSRTEARCKRHHQALVGELLLDLLEPWPQPALAAATRLVHRQPFVNLVVSNVPGPGLPLYAMGSLMLEAIPIVPLAGNLSVGIAALSYEGQLTIGIFADPDACPDVSVLAEGMSRAFAEVVGYPTALESPAKKESTAL
jgi:WS/DGAT/MGAT family acyltransferase